MKIFTKNEQIRVEIVNDFGQKEVVNGEVIIGNNTDSIISGVEKLLKVFTYKGSVLVDSSKCFKKL